MGYTWFGKLGNMIKMVWIVAIIGWSVGICVVIHAYLQVRNLGGQ